MAFNVIVTYQSKAGSEEALASHLRAMLAPTLAEPGCESYKVTRSRDDASLFVLIESYMTEADFELHKSSPHFDEHIRNGAWELLESRTAVFGDDIGG